MGNRRQLECRASDVWRQRVRVRGRQRRGGEISLCLQHGPTVRLGACELHQLRRR